ncbi:Type II secretion system protein G precursor [Aliarcobacter thereius]|nr:prepilin-type N-terminal cleavage/methylation domain-containing protein [Aliarcobacter thereius]OCL86297.1 Type II secretion system protein G precursor [Aliarcobacter thereius]OCL89981.1 Type II secretion system protein G precursor [Aliarcobacter thereius]OCL96419.1 Type II secretion system protein G precursor [Aliarcobacter thereius LMG 24486]QBF15619.1 type II secretion/transformation system, G protein [Aliarcobacter thereius LMG 24486]HJE03908.1 type II secretion system GspH family prote
MKNMKRAFSLIEIIFVIVILGIIVSFAAPKLMDTKDSALVSTLKRDITTTINAVQSYYLLNQKIDSLEDVLTIGTTNWDIEKLSMKDKNSCIRINVINSLNGVKLELIVDPIKDLPICKKIRENGLESKTYDVY